MNFRTKLADITGFHDSKITTTTLASILTLQTTLKVNIKLFLHPLGLY